MAHDFEIRVKNGIWSKRGKWVLTDKNEEGSRYSWVEDDKYKGIPEDQVYFFGYACGIMYKAFNAEEHDAGWSGDNEVITISRKKAINGLKRAIEMFNEIDYPDPNKLIFIT